MAVVVERPFAHAATLVAEVKRIDGLSPTDLLRRGHRGGLDLLRLLSFFQVLEPDTLLLTLGIVVVRRLLGKLCPLLHDVVGKGRSLGLLFLALLNVLLLIQIHHGVLSLEHCLVLLELVGIALRLLFVLGLHALPPALDL